MEEQSAELEVTAELKVKAKLEKLKQMSMRDLFGDGDERMRKSQYNSLSIEWHPDKHPEATKEIKALYAAGFCHINEHYAASAQISFSHLSSQPEQTPPQPEKKSEVTITEDVFVSYIQDAKKRKA